MRVWPADPTQRTLRIPLGAAEPARVHHPQVAKREVVPHRIGRIELPERSRDVLRHPPPWAAVSSQSKTPAHADDVRVERHDQLRRRHAGPHTKIEAVAAHHPTEKQVEPLAGAASRGPRKEVAHTRTFG